jgi:hypothetical protein
MPVRAGGLVDKLICWLRGHRYRTLTPAKVTPFVECTRCSKTGWVL